MHPGPPGARSVPYLHVAVLSVALLPSLVPAAFGQAGTQLRDFEKRIVKVVRAHYLLYLPPAYSKDETKWPAILYLHGGLGRGNDIEKIMWYPLPRMLEHAESFPFIAIMPQCPEGQFWTDTDMLIALLDEVMAK